MSRATREVLRTGRKAPWRLLASMATLRGWSAMVRSTVRHRRGLRRRGAPHVHVAAASHTAHVCEGHPHTAPPPQMPTSCFLPAWRRAAQLSFSIFPNSWLPPQLPPGPSVEPDGPVLSPRGSGTPSVCQQPPLSPSLSLLRVFIQQRFGRGEPAALHLLKRRHCAWGPGPHGPRRAGRVTPVCTSVSAFSLLRVHRLAGRCVSQGGSWSSGFVGTVEARGLSVGSPCPAHRVAP